MPSETSSSGRVGVGGAGASVVRSGVGVNVDGERRSAIADRRVHRALESRGESGAAVLLDGGLIALAAGVTFARRALNADEIGGAGAVLQGQGGGDIGVEGEAAVVGLNAGLVFHAAETVLLTDAHRVLLLPQMGVIVGVGVVEGGESAGDAGVVLKTALRGTEQTHVTCKLYNLGTYE